jgi:hypothetical protein
MNLSPGPKPGFLEAPYTVTKHDNDFVALLKMLDRITFDVKFYVVQVLFTIFDGTIYILCTLLPDKASHFSQICATN